VRRYAAAVLIRPEQPGDIDPIAATTRSAFAGRTFSSGTEAAIVDRLRAAGALLLSLVATDPDPVGHIVFSPVRIGGKDLGWVGLGPDSVRPDRQLGGIGGALIRQGLADVQARGARGCVLLGDPDYYRRFGFRTDPALRYARAPARYFMCLPFAAEVPTGEVTYHAAFNVA
jgi:putative acetyltransferase